MPRPLIIFVDVDETLVHNIGTKQIPKPAVINHVKNLAKEGAILYCWSSGGGEYARDVTRGLRIDDLFQGFLPKPDVMIDDTVLSEWKYLLEVHPNQCSTESVDSYRDKLGP